MRFELDSSTSRRDVFKIGGVTIGLGALLAACGEGRDGDTESARVGNAPVPTALPEYEVDEAVQLRTASSLELTIIAAYEEMLEIEGGYPASVLPVIERLIEDHRGIADEMEALTIRAGGEAWTCTNPWMMERLVDPTIELIQSNVVGIVQDDTSMVQVMAEVVPISEVVTTSLGDITLISSTDGLAAGDPIEFTRLEGAVSEDVMAFSNALENLAAATHQQLASVTTSSEDRQAHLEAAKLESRHSAVLAIEIMGVEGYVSPAVLGQDVVPNANGQIPHFAIESTFGQTGQTEIKAGPGDINNVRESVILQTPAANSYVYNELSCDA